MSERKVLNKYYPPDFDPSKIPRLRLSRDRQYTVRLMAPCNMRCKTCGEYIYKGKKFNARKETVQNEEYLGIKIFRFYIKCPRCLAEITFKTDPENTDYVVEHGATRNFQALKLAEEQAEREAKELEEEEKSNPMKLLENRTKASKQEMEVIEALEELKDFNQRHSNVDFDEIFNLHAEQVEMERKHQEEEDESYIKSVFGREGSEKIKRIMEEDGSNDKNASKKCHSLDSRPTYAFTKPNKKAKEPPNKKCQWEKSIGPMSSQKSLLSGLVTLKKTPKKRPYEESHASIQAEDDPVVSNSGGLSLLGAYSDSDSFPEDN